jgi:hypothetical protein
MNFDVSNLDNGTRLKILDYVLREKKVSYEDLGVSRVMVYNCLLLIDNSGYTKYT